MSSQTPAEVAAAHELEHWRLLANERMAEIQRAREIIEQISGEREAFLLALIGVRLKCVDGVNARPFERLRVIHDVACIAIDVLADEAEARALIEEAGAE